MLQLYMNLTLVENILLFEPKNVNIMKIKKNEQEK